jgi:predicted short-subunit dehydrogenase-like oxidoreductase (DUF2520 family)
MHYLSSSRDRRGKKRLSWGKLGPDKPFDERILSVFLWCLYEARFGVVEVGLIGAGRVGRTLTALLPHEQFQLGPVVGRTPTSARRSVREMAKGKAAASLEDLSSCAVILVTVPDAVLGEVVAKLAGVEFRFAKKVILQTTRMHSSSHLEPLRRRGAAVGSLQPLFVFQRPVPSLAGVYCAVEGDPRATRMARKMIRGWDGEFQLVRADQKLHLGIACSIAGDFLPGLLQMVVQQFALAGFLKKRSLGAISQVLDAAFREFARAGRRARPGPLLREDAVTVRHYLERLTETDPAVADAYRRLARQTLVTLRRKGDEFAFLDSAGDSGGRALGAAAGAGTK